MIDSRSTSVYNQQESTYMHGNFAESLVNTTKSVNQIPSFINDVGGDGD